MKTPLIPCAVACLVSITSSLGTDSSWRPGRISSAPVDPAKTPEGLAPSDWSSICAAYEHGRHAIVANPDGTNQARNPGQAWLTKFDGRGFTVTPDAGGWTWGLELVGYGERTFQSTSSKTEVRHEEGKVSYLRDEGLTEWFVNDTRGLEQGWTLAKRPDRTDAAGPLSLQLAVRGSLRPRVSTEGASVAFVNESGGAVLTYGGLKAWDADGKILEARFSEAEVGHAGFCVMVNDADARYPITIDPIAQQQAYLKASNTEAYDYFGKSVAVAGDTVVVGAYWESSGATGVNGNQADNSQSRSGAAYVFVRSGSNWSQQAYLKASNTETLDYFGYSVALSGDTAVVGAYRERSIATGVNGNQTDNSAPYSGAAYVFVRSGSTWSQQAYLKASKIGGGFFAESVAVSGDTVVVGDRLESSNATGVNGNQANESASGSGAAYVFVRSGTIWSQQAYLKASNTGASDYFGSSIAVSGDTVVVGATNEGSSATGVNGSQADDSASASGAAYVFIRNGSTWSQQAYLKASNTGASDYFGSSIAVSGDTVVVGATNEGSSATGVNGSQADDSASASGAAYVFIRNGSTWSQQAYLKASNTGAGDNFGYSIAVSGDTAVVGAYRERSNATGVNGNQTDNSAPYSGAAYVFVRSGSTWSQQAYLKASNAEAYDLFGACVAVSGDTVVVGSSGESSGATGVNGNQADNSATSSGAAYVFTGLGGYSLVASAVNGVIAGAGAYDIGASATLTATPNPGYLFTGWTGDASGTVNPLEIVMNSDKNVSATFAPDLADSDSDGLGNYDEIVIYGTNPALADTDGDGISDGDEIAQGRNPLISEPVVSNISALQRAGTKLVDITYDVASSHPLSIVLEISSDGGITFAVPATSTSGAIVTGVAAGTGKQITWDAGTDWGGQASSTMRFKVTATDIIPTPTVFSLIPAGTFTMGDALDGDSEAPTHTVNVSAFYMEQNLVTKAQWDAVRTWALSNGYTDLAAGAGKASNHPVQSISWYQMVKWCNARSQQEGLTPVFYTNEAQTTVYKTGDVDVTNAQVKWNANGYRLPTEAEWEKAARGGLSGKRFPWGDTISHSKANYLGRTVFAYDLGPDGYHSTYNDGVTPYTSPVGSFASNGYGLYDMAGNVFERCWDRYDSSYYSISPETDPRGPASGTWRVLRGGFWGGDIYGCRLADRHNDESSASNYGTGFRVARSSVSLGQSGGSGFAITSNVSVDTRMTLTTSALTNGSISGIAVDGKYLTGTTATLTAVPAAGYAFTVWTGAASGTTNPLSLLMNADKTIGAAFTRMPPTISAIADVTIAEDGSTGALAFAISDLLTPASSLSVSGSSNNLGLVPNGNIVFAGSGGSRTLLVSALANQTGSAMITVTVGNGEATATETFLVTVTSVNDAPTISTVSDTVIAENTSTDVLAFTVSDVETAAGSLFVTAQSSNTTLVPTANILLGGTGSQRTVTVTPAANQYGSAIITLSVSDGSASTSTGFVLTVNSVNSAPTISAIADQTINSGTNSGTIGFTVGDLESAAGDLTVTASSNNTVLVPNSGVVIGGSGASRTVTITPVATQIGATAITISVSDGLLTSSESFVLTVQETPFGQDFVWAKGFGGSNSDTAYSIATDATGNAMVAVDFTGSVSFGTFSLTASGSSSDLALLKVAADGNVLSATRFGGANSDFAKAVAADASNNVILAGEFITSTTIGTVTHTSVGSKDISLLKVNSAGTLQWSKRFGGTLSDSVYGLTTDAAGNILITGDFSGSITFGATTLTSSGGRDGFVAKLDPSGTPLWAMKVGGTGNDTAYAVTVSPSGQIVVGGSFSVTASFGTISRTSAGGTDGFAMGVSTAGTVQWATRFGGSANDSARAVAVDVTGAACLAGSFAGTDATFGAEILASEGADDVFVTRLGAMDGSFLNVKQCGGSGADAGLGLAADPFGALYLSGSYSGTAYFDGNSLVTPQGPDAFVAKLSVDGNFLWALEGGGVANDSATSIAANQAGHVFVAGLFAQSARIGSHEVTGGGLVDLFVAKINGPTPSFVTTPGSVTVDVGDPFSIAAPAVGADPITYQWFKGTVPLAGKTSATLQVAAASTGDQGIYHVVATNFFGSSQLPSVNVTVRVPDRILTLEAPAASEENRTLEVPLYLDSAGEVAGLTVELAYDRDLLRNPSFDVGKDLSKQNSTVVVDAVAGTVRVVGSAYPSSIPAGRKLVGTFSFTTRSVPENAVAVFNPTLASISDQFGAPLGGYTKIVGDQTPISRRTIPGDANNNGRLDVSDAAELIRLYANPSQIRTWDNYLNDLNLDGVLTEGDATRVLRVVTKRDNPPSFPTAAPLAMFSMSALSSTDSSSVQMLGSSIAAAPAAPNSIPNAARLVLTRLIGADANKLLAQVYLDDVPAGQAGVSFQVDYPAAVLRIAGASSLTIPAGGLPVGITPTWNVEPGNNYAAQTGSISLAAAWGSGWMFTNGQAVAHIVFELNPAATGQVHFPVTLAATEVGPYNAEGPSTPLTVTGQVVTFSRTYADWALGALGNAAADPNADSDGDGMSNGAEFAASTNPGDANSSLKTTAAEHTPAGFMLRWFAAYGVNYRVRWSGDLVTWENLVSPYPGNGTEAEVNDPGAPAGGRFYRVEVITAP